MGLKEDWVAALRSGNYQQGTGELVTTSTHSPNGKEHCCLGVLCDVAGVPYETETEIIEFDGDGNPVEEVEYIFFTFGMEEFLPDDIAEAVGLPHEVQEVLADMNDGKSDWNDEYQTYIRSDRKNFAQIADYIEQNVSVLDWRYEGES